MTDLEVDATRDGQDESVLQRAVWMTQDAGIPMPPVPSVYAEALCEIELGRVFATHPALAELTTQADIARVIAATGWPPGGLAFGFRPFGTGGRWFYCLASEQQILLVSVRVSFSSAPAAQGGLSLIAQAAAMLESFLGDAVNLARAVASSPTARRLVWVYSNELGLLAETRALWSAEEGLSKFVPSSEVFTGSGQPPLPGAEDVMIMTP